MFKKMTLSDYRTMPWKNGGGLTAEIALEPRDARFPTDPFLWRLSSATVTQGSSFSRFDKYERLLMILSGGGLKLNDFTLPELQSYSFPGIQDIYATPLSSEVKDLGIIYDRSRVDVSFEVIHFSHEKIQKKLPAEWGFVFCVRGEIQFPGGVLYPLESFACGKEEIQLDLSPSAVAVIIQIKLR